MLAIEPENIDIDIIPCEILGDRDEVGVSAFTTGIDILPGVGGKSRRAVRRTDVPFSYLRRSVGSFHAMVTFDRDRDLPAGRARSTLIRACQAATASSLRGGQKGSMPAISSDPAVVRWLMPLISLQRSAVVWNLRYLAGPSKSMIISLPAR